MSAGKKPAPDRRETVQKPTETECAAPDLSSGQPINMAV